MPAVLTSAASAGERLDDLAASSRRSLRADGKAERTATLYDMSVRLYAEWLTAQGRPATLDQLTRSAIREWLGDLLTRNAVSTVRTRWKGLHRFCSWLVAEGELAANPMDGLTAPTAPPAPVPVLSEDPRFTAGSQIVTLINDLRAGVAYASGFALLLTIFLAGISAWDGGHVNRFWSGLATAALLHLVIVVLTTLKRLKTAFFLMI